MRLAASAYGDSSRREQQNRSPDRDHGTTATQRQAAGEPNQPKPAAAIPPPTLRFMTPGRNRWIKFVAVDPSKTRCFSAAVSPQSIHYREIVKEHELAMLVVAMPKRKYDL